MKFWIVKKDNIYILCSECPTVDCDDILFAPHSRLYSFCFEDFEEYSGVILKDKEIRQVDIKVTLLPERKPSGKTHTKPNRKKTSRTPFKAASE